MYFTELDIRQAAFQQRSHATAGPLWVGSADRLTPDQPFKFGSRAPPVDRQVSDVVQLSAPLHFEWPVVIEAAAQTARVE